jgi:hypothetical protein
MLAGQPEVRFVTQGSANARNLRRSEPSGAHLQIFILVSRVYVIFVAASGFLFGQRFFGRIDWSSTVAGLSGVLNGSLSGRFVGGSRLRSSAVILLCLASIA